MVEKRPIEKKEGAPSTHGFAVTPDDNTDLSEVARALYVGVTGNLSLILADDSVAITFVAATAGSILPFAVRRVRSTGTTAASIVALV